MPDIKPPDSLSEFPAALIKNMVVLATSGFGVVVALAWNEFIKTTIDEFISPYFAGSSLLSLLIYALVVTFLAVVVIMQLSSIEKKFEQLQEKVITKKKKAKKK